MTKKQEEALRAKLKTAVKLRRAALRQHNQAERAVFRLNGRISELEARLAQLA